MWAIVKSDALGMCKVVEDEATCIVNLLDDLNGFYVKNVTRQHIPIFTLSLLRFEIVKLFIFMDYKILYSSWK